MKTLELRDTPGRYEFRILRDGVALMNWQGGQRSIFDVQINAQKRFGQCDRVRLLTTEGTVEHEWNADPVEGAERVEVAGAAELRETLEELAKQAACLNVWLNAEDGSIERKARIYAFRNAVDQAKRVLSGGAR